MIGNNLNLFRSICFIFLFLISSKVFADVVVSMKRAETFLLKQLHANEVYVEVECAALDKSYCPTTGLGRLFGTFFLVEAMHDKLSSLDKKNILHFLEKNKRGGQCWAYSADAPIDADDTAFALQILIHLGAQPTLKCLDEKFFHGKENIYATFASAKNPKIEWLPAGTNNLGFHPEVNANISRVFHLAKQKQKINFRFLEAAQSSEGDWYSYFYPSRYYSTYAFMRVLCASNEKKAAVEKGVQFLLKTQNADGSWGNKHSVYDTALALLSLSTCHARQENAIAKGKAYLLQKQLQDGSWASDDIIWQYPFMENPLVVWNAYDNKRVITTSLALSALKQLSLGDKNAKINP